MTPRPTPLTIPDGNARYWVVDTDKGQHHFRHPSYVLGAKLHALVLRYAPKKGAKKATTKGELRDQYAQAVTQLPAMGAMLGACWWHRGFQLVAALPRDPDEEALLDYGIAVADELQEDGYDLVDIVGLFAEVLTGFSARQDVVTMAEARAVFSSPPTAGTTS